MFKKSIRRRRIGTNNGMLVVCQGTEETCFAATLLKPETCSVEPYERSLTRGIGQPDKSKNDW